jgi:hypothetical protein
MALVEDQIQILLSGPVALLGRNGVATPGSKVQGAAQNGQILGTLRHFT